jgi:hypothetical protein
MTDRHHLLTAIEAQRALVEDLEAAVRHATTEFDRAVALFERDRAVKHLHDLIGWLDAPEFRQ